MRSLVLGLGVVVLSTGVFTGCGGGSESEKSVASSETRSSVPPPKPQAEPPAGTASAAPATVADLFPHGEGRDLVLNTCGSCHAVACAALGQRTAARWDSLKQGHSDKLTDQTPAEVDAIFSYLKANFNDAQPEPKVPAAFVEGGCTPF